MSTWQAFCPDCDKGIRGGAPCQTCGGRGHIEVTFTAPLRALEAEMREADRRGIAASNHSLNAGYWAEQLAALLTEHGA